MRRTTITHEFVEYVPRDLVDGVVYVSMRYRTAVHKCLCGCGNKVVTPIRPSDWKLQFDGDAISLMPSIGNWQFPCRSHYWIHNNEVRWAGPWTGMQIAAGQARDQRDKERYFERRAASAQPIPSPSEPGNGARLSLWRRVRALLRGRSDQAGI